MNWCAFCVQLWLKFINNVNTYIFNFLDNQESWLYYAAKVFNRLTAIFRSLKGATAGQYLAGTICFAKDEIGKKVVRSIYYILAIDFYQNFTIRRMCTLSGTFFLRRRPRSRPAIALRAPMCLQLRVPRRKIRNEASQTISTRQCETRKSAGFPKLVWYVKI